jgi:hypothetical protein
MQIDVTPLEYKLIQELRQTRPPEDSIIESEALKPLRWVVEVDCFDQDWHGAVGAPPAPHGKGSNAVASRDEEGHTILARTRHLARNSDAPVRISIAHATPQEMVETILFKAAATVAGNWQDLIYSPGPGSKQVREARDFYTENDWYSVLPRPHEGGE